MKTTIELSDALLARARKIAEEERTTLRALVEEGLRRALDERKRAARPFKLRNASFRGKGMRPDVAEGSWERIRNLVYEGRGILIAVDTNVLVHAHREDATFHGTAAAAVRGLAEGSATWAIPWPCLHEFLGVVTHPRIFDPPTPLASALDQLTAWAESPMLVLLTEGPGHLASLRDLLLAARVVGPAVHDARIAALCLEHRVSELWTADRDFGRFPGLRTRNPLVD